MNHWINQFDELKRLGRVSREQELDLLRSFGDALSENTLQGFSYRRPHGYAGDFEIIDRIYTHWVSPLEGLRAWDQFFHAQAAPKAVRNRKDFLHGLLDQLQDGARVLNVGSGPGRCIYEWLDRNPLRAIRIDCIDMDDRAIAYSRSLNSAHLDRVSFTRENALRLKPRRRYDLIWAAGLFDYFRDSTFVATLKRLAPALDSGGKLVVGNFSVANPTRAYMEMVGWVLLHRSEAQLAELMRVAGLEAVVEAEPEGVNLFAVSRAPA